MKIKRIAAYLLDFIIVTMIASLIFTLPLFKNDYEEYNKKYIEYSEILDEQMKNGSSEVDEDILLSANYKVIKSSTSLLIIRLTVLITYFCIIAYFLKGQTLGKKVFKIQVTDLDGKLPQPGLFMLRGIILTNAIPEIISLFILILANESTYIASNNYITYATLIIYFLIVGFMIFRDDERGLHDIICKTKVITLK